MELIQKCSRINSDNNIPVIQALISIQSSLGGFLEKTTDKVTGIIRNIIKLIQIKVKLNTETERMI